MKPEIALRPPDRSQPGRYPLLVATAIRPTTDARPDGDLEEIARLDLLRRLSMGAAHTLNNAFTGILGETLCLLDDRKDDPAVVEACTVIQHEVERCARITRLVALRAQPRERLIDETDVGTLLRGVETLLRETVSRALTIEVAATDAGLGVRGAIEDCELLVLSAVHGLVRDHAGGGVLSVAAAPAEHTIDVVIALRADRASAPRAEHGWQRAVRSALEGIAARIGAELLVEDPHTIRVRLARAE